MTAPGAAANSRLSFAFAAAFVYHCMLPGLSAPLGLIRFGRQVDYAACCLC